MLSKLTVLQKVPLVISDYANRPHSFQNTHSSTTLLCDLHSWSFLRDSDNYKHHEFIGKHIAFLEYLRCIVSVSLPVDGTEACAEVSSRRLQELPISNAIAVLRSSQNALEILDHEATCASVASVLALPSQQLVPAPSRDQCLSAVSGMFHAVVGALFSGPRGIASARALVYPSFVHILTAPANGGAYDQPVLPTRGLLGVEMRHLRGILTRAFCAVLNPIGNPARCVPRWYNIHLSADSIR